jgi:hypothetical protein
MVLEYEIDNVGGLDYMYNLDCPYVGIITDCLEAANGEKYYNVLWFTQGDSWMTNDSTEATMKLKLNYLDYRERT